ncbi:MAG TPA: M23 family peptidase, partial [Ruthenibacterium lactatiformans]|nr:M23 family peptidase [Ruthenibacterium lactatiformans]
GPHLHYEARIGNQSIDPDQLFNGSSGLYFAR